MKKNISNWKRNVFVFKIDYFLNWFYVPIGVWVLVWTQFFSFTQITIATSAGLFLSMLLELPSGALADLLGRKKTIILGRILLFIAYVLLAVNQSYTIFLIWNLLYHADGAFTSGSGSALLYDSLKENNKEKKHYKKTEANTFMYCTLGMAIGSILGGWLFKLDVLLPYRIMTLVTGLGVVASLFYIEPELDTEKFNLKNYLKQNIEGIKHIFDRPLIRSISIFSILINTIAWIGVWYLYEPRISEGSFDPRIMSLIISGTYLMRALGTRLIPVMDRILKKYQVPIFLSIFQTLSSLLSFITNKIGAISSVYLRKASDGFRQPTVYDLQNEQIDSKYRATSLSAINLITNLFLSIAGIGMGMFIDRYSASTALGIFGVLGIFTVIPLAIMLSEKIKR